MDDDGEVDAGGPLTMTKRCYTTAHGTSVFRTQTITVGGRGAGG